MNSSIDKQQLLAMDAISIATCIKNRDISIEECVTVFIEHIQQINEKLNAIVENRFTEALQEAALLDDKITSINLDNYPLYGVPISIKEAIDVKNMKTTGGLPQRKNLIKSTDADVVEKLKQAGAIILGKTNTPPLSFCQETDNKLYGRTNNAWNVKHTAGGSSGGEAALIATGGTALGIGSDIGGSIRFPTHLNGTVGFKPGKFQVSNTGHLPANQLPLKNRMSSIGPITKSVRDARLIYQLTKNHQIHRKYYEKMQIDMLPTDNGYPLDDATKAIMEEVYQFMKPLADISWSFPPYFTESAKIWQEIMSIDGAVDIKRVAFNDDRPNLWKHYVREKLTRKTPNHTYLSWALLGANMFKPSDKRLKEIKSFLKEGDYTLERHLNNRLLFFPVYHTSGLNHGELFKEIFSLSKSYLKYMPYVAYANIWGLPALTIPLNSNQDGNPISLQIMSAIGNEDTIFNLGEVIEDYFSGYRRSTLYDQSPVS
ncbi:MAG TPA: amidase [Pseudogracilibacillus sp.]|nr:amidase [Pseudogracilibacillus sp.]